MAWIKWVIGLQDRPEVLYVAEQTSKEPELIAALCMIAWAWADSEGHDGFVANGTLKMLDLVVKKAPGFAEAMSKTEWLKDTGKGLQFNGWETHNSQSAKDRALNQKRVAELRGRTESAQKAHTNRTQSLPEESRGEYIKRVKPSKDEIEKLKTLKREFPNCYGNLVIPDDQSVT